MSYRCHGSGGGWGNCGSQTGHDFSEGGALYIYVYIYIYIYTHVCMYIPLSLPLNIYIHIYIYIYIYIYTHTHIRDAEAMSKQLHFDGNMEAPLRPAGRRVGFGLRERQECLESLVVTECLKVNDMIILNNLRNVW